MSAAAASDGLLSIGEVLHLLRSDFPDVSISKIRYLEAEDLVEPQRTASGYRKFTRADAERLRYVLRMQRDHYLPLKVIREHLDAIDRGLQPAPLSATDTAPRARDRCRSPRVRVVRCPSRSVVRVAVRGRSRRGARG